MHWERFLASVLGFSPTMMFVNPGNSGPPQERPQEPESKGQELSTTSITGKICYQKSGGGYFICIGHPFSKFKIANQDPELLERYLKRGGDLNIEGTKGTNPIFIEKINGQPYEGGMRPPSANHSGIISRIVDRLTGK